MQLAANNDLYNDPFDLCYENLILSMKDKNMISVNFIILII
jgi:hypothetical protein